MTEPKKYWIASAMNELALVDGADARDQWVKVHGWHEITEPRPTDQVYIWRDGVDSPGRIPLEALEGWEQLGWKAGPPPERINITKDPRLVDQPAAPVAAEPAKQTKPASGGDKGKE